MSGVGSLTKIGTGTFTLTGSNTYRGGTTVSGGALQLGSGTANGSIGGTSGLNLAAGAIVDYDLSSSDTIGYRISGQGSLHLLKGTLILTSSADNYLGGTYVNSGELIAAVVGALPTGTNLTIGNAALLGDIVPASYRQNLSGDATDSSDTVPLAPVPEPGTLELCLAALAAVVACRSISLRNYA